jgi:hypothetical protein
MSAGSGGRRRRGALAFATLVAAGFVATRALRPSKPPEPAAHSTSAAAPGAPAAPTERPRPDDGPRPPAAGAALPLAAIAEHERAVARQAKRFEALDHAVDLARFPPDSRPLTSSMTDVLRPNTRHEQPTPLVTSRGARPEADPERAPYVLFTGPRYALTPGAPLAATLEVFRGRPDEGRRAKAPVEVRACSLRAPGPGPHAEGLPLNDRGAEGDLEAGDLTYSIALDATALPGFERYNGPVRLDVAFTTPASGEVAHASLDFLLTAAPPARFDGRVGETLTAGGLALRVGLEVERPGRYVVQGLLFDARGEPVGLAVDRPQLATGPAEATLLFFGLLFHESDAQAPFVLRTVTGYRLPEADEPARLDLAPLPGEYRTRPYPRSAFSRDEWQSTSKDRRLDALRDLAEKNPDKVLVSGTPSPSNPAPATPPLRLMPPNLGPRVRLGRVTSKPARNANQAAGSDQTGHAFPPAPPSTNRARLPRPSAATGRRAA